MVLLALYSPFFDIWGRNWIGFQIWSERMWSCNEFLNQKKKKEKMFLWSLAGNQQGLCYWCDFHCML